MNFLVAFTVSFVYIFLKATQQLNVLHLRYKWVMPVSLGMALCEATIVLLVVNTGIASALFIGLGGGLGCMLSMSLFGKKKGMR